MDPILLTGGVSQDIVEVYDPGIQTAMPPLVGGVQVNTVPGGNVSGTQTAAPSLSGGVSAIADAGGNTFNQTYAPVTDNRSMMYAPNRSSAPVQFQPFAPVPDAPPPMQHQAVPLMQSPMPSMQPMQAPNLQPNFGPINIPQLGDFQQNRGGNVAQAPQSQYINIGNKQYPANSIVAYGGADYGRDAGVPDVMSDAGGGYPPVAPQRPPQLLPAPQQPMMDYSQGTSYGGNNPVGVTGVNWRDRIAQAQKVAPQAQSDLANNLHAEAVGMTRNIYADSQIPYARPAPPRFGPSVRGNINRWNQYNAEMQAYSRAEERRRQDRRNSATNMTSLAGQANENARSQARIDLDTAKMLYGYDKDTDDRVAEELKYMDEHFPLFPADSPVVQRDPEINRRHILEREAHAGRMGRKGIDLWPAVYKVNYNMQSQIAGRDQRNINSGLQGQYLAGTLPARIEGTKSRAKIAALTADFLGKVAKDRVAAESARAQLAGLHAQYGEQLYTSTLDARAQGIKESAARLLNQDLDNNLAIINGYRASLGQFNTLSINDVANEPTTPEEIASRQKAKEGVLNSLKSYGPVNKNTGVPKMVDDAYSALLKSTHPADPSAGAIAEEKKQEATQAIKAGIPSIPKPQPANAPPPPANRLIAPPEPHQVQSAYGMINPWSQ